MNFIGLYTLVRREVQRMFRVPGQTILSPLISATLYVFIFGFVIGTSIDEVAGVPYITFVLPGVLMLNIISSSFQHTSSSVYFGRFMRHIEEILVSPLSYFEVVLGFVVGGVVRAVVIAVGIIIVGLLFGAVTLNNPLAFLGYVVGIGAVFSLLGILVGLWAEGFEQLSALNIFVITPLTYLGGVFYSITMLPEKMQVFTHSNPFFYFGVSEANTTVGLVLIVGLVFFLGWLVMHLLRIGWKIRP